MWEVSFKGFDTGLEIYYIIDESKPYAYSLKYNNTVLLNKKSIIKEIIVNSGSGKSISVTSGQFDVSKLDWNLFGEFQSVKQTRFMFNGNPESAWNIKNVIQGSLSLDLSENLNLTGFTYLPEQGRWIPDIIYRF